MDSSMLNNLEMFFTHQLTFWNYAFLTVVIGLLCTVRLFMTPITEFRDYDRNRESPGLYLVGTIIATILVSIVLSLATLLTSLIGYAFYGFVFATYLTLVGGFSSRYKDVKKAAKYTWMIRYATIAVLAIQLLLQWTVYGT